MRKHVAFKRVSYAVLERVILERVSFTCDTSERLCIFGENGAGKSTMLKILCGMLEPDEGVVEKGGHVRFVYVSQEFDQRYKDKTVEEYIGAEAGESLYKKIFSNSETLGFPIEKHLSARCGGLSGGQQKILALSVAFAIAPDFLLLDEPENHLDIVSRVELIKLLSEYKHGIIFVSHDRLLIDAVATKIGELSHGELQLSEGNYDDYIEMKMARLGGLARESEARAKRIRQLTSSLGIKQQKAIRGKEIAAYHKAKDELAELKEEQKENKVAAPTKINIPKSGRELHGGKLLCRIKDAQFKYENAPARTFDEVSLEMRAGDKIVLLGRNGSGKSTFLKMLIGTLEPTGGSVFWAEGVTHAYFDQHAEFDIEKSAVEIVGGKLKCVESVAQAALGAMRFDLSRMTTASKNLSGGERMRLRFAIAFGQKPDCLILDEPTNHIDEVTWEVLLDACTKSKSSILLVTHDYEFIEAFKPTLFWMLQGQHIMERHKHLDHLLTEMKSESR
jgi:ATP-binding cassette subfamily F protein uup